MFAVAYGVTAGLRGYLFSVINADLIQVCRGACSVGATACVCAMHVPGHTVSHW